MKEELLDKLIKQAKSAGQIDGALLNLSEDETNEIKPLLKTSLLLSSLPKNVAPEPAKRRLYANPALAHQGFLRAVFHISNWAKGGAAFAVVLLTIAIGGYQALSSMPGQPLFAVKRSAETFRLKFVMSESVKAQLQLEYAQNRLNEAQAILNDPQSNKQQEIAALNELANQTQAAAQSVQKLALNQPLEPKNHPIVNKLENLAKDQASLIAQTQNSDADVKIAASSAASASETAAKSAGEIKKYLAIAQASVDPVSLVDLSNDPDLVSVSGLVQKSDKTSLNVEKLNFILNDQTEIKDISGAKIPADQLKANLKVKVSAKKDHDKLLAQSVIILSTADTSGSVQGTSTSPSLGATSTSPVISSSTAPSTQTTTPDTTHTTDNLPQQPEKPRLGSFLIEDPSPQYSP